MSVLLVLAAAALSVRILRLAIRHPRISVFLLCGTLLCVPVALLRWAHAPRVVAVLPLLLLLAFAASTCAASAIGRSARIGGKPCEHARPRRDSGWWTAPVMPGPEPAQGSAAAPQPHTEDDGVANDSAFDELIERNFPDHR